MNRRQLLLGSASLAVASMLGRPAAAQDVVSDPQVALRMLKEGNERYVAGLKTSGSGRGADRRGQVTQRQTPYATILSCADSRVAPEVLFDAGIGDLFVIRIAGNIVSGSNYGVIGSAEFAAAVLKAPLVLVLGHENCGAVRAAIDTIDRKETLPGAIEDIVEAIRPAAESARGQAGDGLHNAIAENVKLGMKRLRMMSTVLPPMLESGKVQIVGGIYDLGSGRVSFL